jgi:hypothetical protein
MVHVPWPLQSVLIDLMAGSKNQHVGLVDLAFESRNWPTLFVLRACLHNWDGTHLLLAAKVLME